MEEVVEFVCKMYRLDSVKSVDEARAILFSKKGNPEALPQTSDALSRHVKRLHYQAIVWKEANWSEPRLPHPETLGLKKVDDNKLQPFLITQNPIPTGCQEIISSSCSTECTNLRCSCKSNKVNIQSCKHGHQRNSVMSFIIEHNVRTFIDYKVINLWFEKWPLGMKFSVIY